MAFFMFRLKSGICAFPKHLSGAPPKSLPRKLRGMKVEAELGCSGNMGAIYSPLLSGWQVLQSLIV